MNQYSTVMSPVLKDYGGSIRLKISRIIFWLMALYLWTLVLDGPIRYFSGYNHIEALIYLPKLLLCLPILLLPILRPRMSHAAFSITAIIIFYLILGLINLHSSAQALFGLWVCVPMLFGAWSAVYLDFVEWRKLISLLFVTALVGVFINIWIVYPWSGSSLVIMGHTIEVSREWQTLIFDRYAGFSSASFNVASQLLVFSTLLVVFFDNRLMKSLIWISAGIGIAVTTSKGPLATWLILTVYFFGGWLFSWQRIWLRAWIMFLGIFIIVELVLPLSTLWIRYNPHFEGFINQLMFESFGDRLRWTWPQSLELLNLRKWSWLTGRGLGGIGISQRFFEPHYYITADNMFVYLIVDMGLPVALITIITTYVMIAKKICNGINTLSAHIVFPLYMSIVLYGMVVNLIEDPLLSFMLGVILVEIPRLQKVLPLVPINT